MTLKADWHDSPGTSAAVEKAWRERAPEVERQMKEALEEMESGPRKKFCYVGAPAIFKLKLACHDLVQAFDSYGVYLVGSALQRPDWRDVDLRMIMPDEAFYALFPDVQHPGHWEFDPRWLILTVSISDYLSKVSGLPIDFQFQPQSHANERHKGPRQPVGMRLAKPAGD